MKKQSLFDIGLNFYALSDMSNDIEFNEETGEIIDNSPELQELFDEIQEELSVKLDNTAYIFNQLKSDAEMLKKEKLRLGKKQTALENKAEILKRLMLGALEASGEKSIKTLKHSFTLSKSE